jgi:hypothetical protein
MARLRCGNLGLRVRNGAWVGETRDCRVCRFCSSGKLEDEAHVILSCPFFQSPRKILYDNIQMQLLHSSTEYELIKSLLYDHLLEFAKFIHTISKSIDVLNDSV